jgi:hypothetical protein
MVVAFIISVSVGYFFHPSKRPDGDNKDKEVLTVCEEICAGRKELSA